MLSSFLIICPLTFLAGFVDAVAGGGGLISLPAYMMGGLPVHAAIATNKVSSGMGLTMAVWRYSRSGYIRWKLAAACVVCAMVGSSAGANLALLIDDGAFKVLMLFILPLTGWYVMRGNALRYADGGGEASPRRMLLVGMASALIIGMYDGFYGPGAGTFVLLLLTGVARMKLSDANGVAKVINWTTALSSLVVYLMNGVVNVPLGLAAGLFSMAGSYLGTRFFDRDGIKSVKLIIPIVLVIFFIKLLLELF